MSDNQKRNLHIVLFFVTLALLGIGGYALYDYERVKKINATVVTPTQAMQIILQNS